MNQTPNFRSKRSLLIGLLLSLSLILGTGILASPSPVLAASEGPNKHHRHHPTQPAHRRGSPTPKPTQSGSQPTRQPSPSRTPVPTQPATQPAPTAAPTNPPSSGGSSSGPLGVSGTWNLKWSDEFNGSSLDTSKWTPNWLGSANAITKPINGSENSCYDPKQVSITGGNLKLSAVARSCNGYPYASGAVTSSGKFTFAHGYMEARIWTDGSSNVKNWPAFWADGTGTWPTTGEIDVMEGLGGSTAWHYHWGSGNGSSVGGSANTSPRAGWHTYGADWESGSITFYYDGKQVGKATSGVVNNNMFLILNYAVSSSISGPIQVPSDMLVDYVRVWQH